MLGSRVQLVAVGAVLALLSPALCAQNAYMEPLKPLGFRARAVVLPARKIGDTVIRAQQALAVEIQVEVRGFVPRAMEPALLISGIPAGVSSGIAGVQGDVTTLSFIVEKPELLKEGASLAVQMGDAARTRATVRGVLHRAGIQPLPEGEARRSGLPPLSEWLRQTQPSRD